MVNRLIDLGSGLGQSAVRAGRRAVGAPAVKSAASAGAGVVASGAISAGRRAAGSVAIAGAGVRGATGWVSRQQARRSAIGLAAQIKGAGYSEDTMVDGTPHFVVWKHGVPIDAFPQDVKGVLAARPELQDFQETRIIFPS